MAEDKDLSYVPMTDLMTDIKSRHKVVVLAARRAVELNNGADNLVGAGPKMKVSTVALEEIRKGLVTLGEKDRKK